MADYDSPWKEALDLYFEAFVAFFRPEIHNDIDWSRGWESLDKELQQLAVESEQGRRYVDKLMKVWRKDGSEAWVLIHIEVQTTPEADFAWRMYVYSYRIRDSYNRKVASVAVLADDDPGWRPDHYEEELWGCSTTFRFLPSKLLDWAGREAVLEADTNPFARVALAHLAALQTRRDAPARQTWKLRLVRGLYQGGFSPEDVRKLFRLIDWLMELPPALNRQFWKDFDDFQKERAMPFMTTPERVGRWEALWTVIEDALRTRFGDSGVALMPEVRNIYDFDQLRSLNLAVWQASSLDEVRGAFPTPPPSDPTSP
jgi:hypothetical protein